MQKARILLSLGVWTMILPYLGFPHSWKDIIVMITGASLVFVSYLIYKDSNKKETKHETIFENFKENNFESVGMESHSEIK